MQTLDVLDNRFSQLNIGSPVHSESMLVETSNQNLFDNQQVLLFMKQLQTTLDINEVLTMLANVARRYIDFSALSFKNQQLSKTIRGDKKGIKEHTFELEINDTAIGTLSYEINSPINLTSYRMLEKLHQCLLYPLKNTMTYYTAMQLAMQDALTNLGNRRCFDEQLKRAMNNATRHHTSVGMVLCDLNKFKSINDCFGHKTGDMVLKEFADILRHCIRDSDSLFRFGGDEFAIIIENATGNALNLIEKRIYMALAKNELLSKYQLGCSLGSTYMKKSDNEESFFERADRILYYCKD